MRGGNDVPGRVAHSTVTLPMPSREIAQGLNDIRRLPCRRTTHQRHQVRRIEPREYGEAAPGCSIASRSSTRMVEVVEAMIGPGPARRDTAASTDRLVQHLRHARR